MRKINFSSPGINREYEAYATASLESGISPLTIQDYAKSRKLHFSTKGELFDGFLDD
jgi:hypothetical protein